MSLTCRPYCQAEGKIIPGCWQAYQMKERAWLWGLGMGKRKAQGMAHTPGSSSEEGPELLAEQKPERVEVKK